MADTEPLTRQDCDSVVRQHLKTEDVTVRDYTLVPLENENFQLKITVYHATQKTVVDFFVKNKTSQAPKIISVEGITPKLYLAKENLLIFEDLTREGFQNFDSKFDFLHLDHIRLVVDALAKLHTTELAPEEGETDFLEMIEMKKLISSEEEVSKILQDSSKFRRSRIQYEYGPEEGETNFLETKKLLFSEEVVAKVLQDLSKFRRSLIHGNLLSKNILFKGQKGVPVECRLINLERKCGPGVYDLLQLIFFNSTEDLRQHYFHSLIAQYENELKKFGEEQPIEYHHFLPLVKLETVLRQGKPNEEEMKEILHCPLLSKEDCYAIVEKKIGTTNYEFLDFKIIPLSDVSGFLGEYQKLQIKIRYLSEEKTFNCFIKRSPKSGIAYDIAQDLSSFAREVFMYQILGPQMQNHGIKTFNECLPRCYFQRPNDFMVFEDMSLLNYKNLDALKPLDFIYLKMLTKKLARFHSCSLILEEKVSKELGKPYRIIDAYGKYLEESLFFIDEKHLGARFFMTGIKSILAATQLFPEIKTEQNQENFKKFWPKLQELFYTVVKTSDRFRNVLSHGDLWTSNMLVKFEEDKPTDCVVIDFQMIRYCPPGYDLLSVLHRTTNRATRLKYEKELIEIYYEELAQVLDSYGFSVKDVYPYEDYISCVKYMRPQMVLQEAVECVWTMCTPEEISSFLSNEESYRFVYLEDRTEFLTTMCEKSVLYRTRLGECILDIYDYCDSMVGFH